MRADEAKARMMALADEERAKALRRFFKTGKDEYAEGDEFLGITVPQTRKVVKEFVKSATLDECLQLLCSKYHEIRLLALLSMVQLFKKSDECGKKSIYEAYLANTKHINNWDLVDQSAGHIVGAYLFDKGGEPIFSLASSSSLWERRIAMIATFYSIMKGDGELALKVAKMLLKDKESLIHKAVGWMLREVHKRCEEQAVCDFLEKNYNDIPRTTLRYAIERFSPEKKSYFMKCTSKNPV